VIAGNQISPNVQPQVKAVNLGSANITASAPGFTGDTQAVQVTGSIKFEVGRVTIFAGDTKNIALILSGPAPPGLTVTLTSDSDAAKVPATLTFAPNATSVNVPVLGFARGSATIHASAAPNLADTTIMVTVP